MPLPDWAELVARNLLEEPLPRRWEHTLGVARTARTLAPILGEHAELLLAAAWLHDIGYAPTAAITGFHALDGARHLRDAERADEVLCRLVAHHTCAINEAERRGLAGTLSAEFAPPPPGLADALIYCDMTTSPDGRDVHVGQRIAEIIDRYGPDHLVSRAIKKSATELTAAVDRITRGLAARDPRGLPDVRMIARREEADPLPHRPVHLIAERYRRT